MKKTIWKTIPLTNGFYQVSDLGDIRTVKRENRHFSLKNLSKQIYTPVSVKKHTKKYNNNSFKVPFVEIEELNYKTTKPLSAIVYSAFHKIGNLSHLEIFHVDGNEFNNSIHNLILCEKKIKLKILQSNNNIISSQNKNLLLPHHITQSLSLYNHNGIRIKYFQSINELNNIIDLPTRTIGKILNNMLYFHYNSLIIKRGIGPVVIDTNFLQYNMFNWPKLYKKLWTNLFFQFDKNGFLKEIYNNIFEASISNKISINELYDAALNYKLLSNYYWIIEN